MTTIRTTARQVSKNEVTITRKTFGATKGISNIVTPADVAIVGLWVKRSTTRYVTKLTIAISTHIHHLITDSFWLEWKGTKYSIYMFTYLVKFSSVRQASASIKPTNWRHTQQWCLIAKVARFQPSAKTWYDSDMNMTPSPKPNRLFTQIKFISDTPSATYPHQVFFLPGLVTGFYIL